MVAACAGTDPATLAERMHSALFVAIGLFLAAAFAIALTVRALGRSARRLEDEAQLDQAFREIEDDLVSRSASASEPSAPASRS
ncbi:hypothetical protein BH09MYX1_BH09MYX1_15940 [soil metagenome]